MIGAELQVEIDIQTVLFEFVGGLGIFLLGIKYMGDGLQKSAGDGLRDILDKFTSNPFMCICGKYSYGIVSKKFWRESVYHWAFIYWVFVTFTSYGGDYGSKYRYDGNGICYRSRYWGIFLANYRDRLFLIVLL